MAEQSCVLNGKPGRQTLLEVQDYFSLPSPALVEKDWHVVQALAAIRDAASDGLTLAFGGGTALARAYGLLQRMAFETMKDDAATRGGDFPAYQADPLRETLRAVETMGADRAFRADYSILMDAMVYGDKPTFEDATAVVREFADHVAAGMSAGSTPI